MDDFIRIVPNLVAVISIAFAIVSIIGAFRAGVLQRLRLGAFEIEGSPRERDEARDLIAAVSKVPREDVPFETEQLARYYGQVLGQSRTAFWFSLVFASLGFAVIIGAVFLYTGAAIGATVAQFAAGTIMDAVAGLFFIQSRNAQKSMAEFFDKLRRDRNHLESRKLCENLEHNLARDALRIQLSLHYAEVADASNVSKTIIEGTLVPRSTRRDPAEA